MKEILQNLLWIEELLPLTVQSIPKHGGLAYYLDGVQVLILVEQSLSSYEHKGVSYPFRLWNGCIIPVEYKRQSAFFLKYVFLENHPVKRDWLYIPAESENFEEEVRLVLREINRGNPLLGIQPKAKALTSEPETSEGKGSEAKKKTARKKTRASKADKKKENAFVLGIARRGRGKG